MGPTNFSAILFLFLLRVAAVKSQSTPSSPAGPTNVTGILEKAGQFTTLIRLFQITQIGDQINTQLNNSNQGITVFAPTDAAFSALPAGTLNSLSDQQKVSLIQFHILPSFVSIPQFQTVSNPLRTQAGDTAAGEFPLNVTAVGNQVNISTGVDSASIGNTIYTDSQLAVYQIDKVLLPDSLFGSPAPAPAPESGGSSTKKKPPTASTPASPDQTPGNSSGAGQAVMRGIMNFGICGLVSIYISLFQNYY